MNIKKGVGIYFLLLIMAVVPTSHIALSSNIDEYFIRVKSIVSNLERVSDTGLDTSRVEYYLNNALSLLDKGNLTTVEKEWVEGNLSLAEIEVNSLVSSMESYVLWRNIRLGLTVFSIALIPVLTYVFLPRIWAYMWFKTRKKWIVKKRSS